LCSLRYPPPRNSRSPAPPFLMPFAAETNAVCRLFDWFLPLSPWRTSKLPSKLSNIFSLPSIFPPNSSVPPFFVIFGFCLAIPSPQGDPRLPSHFLLLSVFFPLLGSFSYLLFMGISQVAMQGEKPSLTLIGPFICFIRGPTLYFLRVPLLIIDYRR